MLRGLDQFLIDYPGMSVIPGGGTDVVVAGEFRFAASTDGREPIADSYQLKIEVPQAFPRGLPAVIETGRRIPRHPDFHVNPDGTLCVGAPIRLLLIISDHPGLDSYASLCLVPYLYAISHKLKFGGGFIFDELEHGKAGALQDYLQLFGLKQPGQAREALRLLSMREKDANRQRCPCGCGRMLGRCEFREVLKRFRVLTNRAWFAAHPF
jgi:hypothetical protein